MKKSTIKISKIILAAFFLLSSNIMAQVVDGDSIPEMQSISNEVLIPKMSTAQRTSIASPATGVLVFDKDTQSFWLYSGSWVELETGSPKSIVDNDGDTKVEIEQSIDEDKIRLTTAGSERMTLDNSGNVRIGDGTNNTYIESDGSLSYEGTATRYDDLKVPLSSTLRGGAEDPTFEAFKKDGEGSVGVYAARFKSNATEDVFFVVQMPHAWVEGTEIYPHLHWSPISDTGGDKVRWGFEFTWADVIGTFDDTTILYAEDPIPPIGGAPTAYQHVITSFKPLSGSGHTLSSMLICRVFRDGTHDNDTYKGFAYLLEFDFHYQIDSDGSREQYVK